MPRLSRAQRFLVNPHAFIDDPAVQLMPLPARGAYAILWLAGWDQKVPGVYLGDDRVLAQLARCTPEEWASVRDDVRTAFTVTSVTVGGTERDMWELPGFSVTLHEQTRKRDTDRKRQQRKRLKERDVTVGQERDSLDGSGSGSGSRTEKKKDSGSSRPSVSGNPAPPLAALNASAALDGVRTPPTAEFARSGPRRATCAQCGNTFLRPDRSRQRLCPPCFVAAASDPSASTAPP